MDTEELLSSMGELEGSPRTTPQEHRSFAEFAKDKLDSGKQ